ncbi:FG-GAP-like repeat-containing protein [Geomonas sp. Red32]|uniref:FG-GAP repeat domain-containing protein n=1 Tax=Geomonas sp. Red32 TaxID=2912856 RepID=UPI00202CD323|nr:FG-GAP-like repeat-containing protein [Geomonas sp. Red32]
MTAVLVAGCGGGGGGGAATEAPAITYSGLTTPAAVNAANAGHFFAIIWNGGASAQGPAQAKAANGAAPAGKEREAISSLAGKSVRQQWRAAKAIPASWHSIRNAVPINETIPGTVSGTLQITGSLDDSTGTGRLSMSYRQFNDGDGYTYDGVTVVVIAAYNPALGAISDGTLTTNLLRARSDTTDISISGTLRMQADQLSSTQTLTLNLSGQDNLSQEGFKFENFIQADTADNWWNPGVISETMQGRCYLSTFGYVEVSTPVAYSYSGVRSYPTSGGPLVMRGAQNSSARITPLSTTFMKLEVDADGNDTYESKYSYVWNDLDGGPVTAPPVASAGPDLQAGTGDTVTLDGGGSSDLLAYPITFNWTIASKPAGSTAALENPASATPSFFVDLPGTYTVTLVVNNGLVDGAPDQVVITASGPPNSNLFRPYVKFPVGSDPRSIAIGDLNGDGRNDVVLATGSYFDPDNDYRIFVFLQNSAGGFDAPVKYPGGNGNSIAVADLNNDGRQDVVFTTDNGIGVMYQNAAGTLDPMVFYASNHQSFSNAYKLKTGDFNHDGRTDVVSIDWGTQSQDVDVYLQNSGGTLNTPVTYTVSHGGWDKLAVGDVNGDGMTDIVVMSGQLLLPSVGVLIQRTDGTFAPAVYHSVEGNQLTSGVAVGDVTGDSLQDIVLVYGGNAGRLAVFPQNSDTVIVYPSYDSPDAMAIADLNADGRNDIAVIHTGWIKAGVYLQNAAGALGTEELYPLPYAPRDLAIGDVNGDGRPDLVIPAFSDGLVVLYHR